MRSGPLTHTAPRKALWATLKASLPQRLPLAPAFLPSGHPPPPIPKTFALLCNQSWQGRGSRWEWCWGQWPGREEEGVSAGRREPGMVRGQSVGGAVMRQCGRLGVPGKVKVKLGWGLWAGGGGAGWETYPVGGPHTARLVVHPRSCCCPRRGPGLHPWPSEFVRGGASLRDRAVGAPQGREGTPAHPAHQTGCFPGRHVLCGKIPGDKFVRCRAHLEAHAWTGPGPPFTGVPLGSRRLGPAPSWRRPQAGIRPALGRSWVEGASVGSQP